MSISTTENISISTITDYDHECFYAFELSTFTVCFSWLIDVLLRDKTCSFDDEQMELEDLPQFAWMRKLMRMSGVQVNIQVNED